MVIIYFDNAATTKVNESIIPELLSMMTENYGNPSSLHLKGIQAENKIIKTKRILSELLGAEGNVVFTSGGTEANNMAIRGIAEAYIRNGKHIIVSVAEHPSVLNCVKELATKGWEMSLLPVTQSGQVNFDSIGDIIRDDTVLVALLHVNNETGAVNPVNKVGEILKKRNPLTKLHVDGVQGFGKVAFNLDNVDTYSVSAHKLHGMKGAGALYIKKGVVVKPLIYGGGQQGGMRAGTENTVGIVSLGLCAEQLCANIEKNFNNVSKVKLRLLDITQYLENVYINGDVENDSPYILNLSFMGVRAETLVHALAEKDIFISTGAACSSRNKKTVHPYFEKERSLSSVRFSFSALNTLEEAERCIEVLCSVVPLLRKISYREEKA